MADIEFEIKASKIGPHKNLNAKYEVNSLKMGIFAENGRGKTFLSSLFNLFKPEDSILESIPTELISLGETNGEFYFSVKNKNSPTKDSFKAELNRSNGVNIPERGSYIFHVFNEHFIKNNLQTHSYTTALLDVPGEILLVGKEKIDLKEEKEKLTKIKEQFDEKENALKREIKKLQDRLKALKVYASLEEFSKITYENFITPIDETLPSIETIKTSYEKSSSMPETKDIIEISFLLDKKFLDNVETLLKTSYSKSTISEIVKQRISANSGFYETGLALKIEDSKCPFCEQNLTDAALKVIEIYENYFNDEEAKVLKEIDKFKTLSESLNKSLILLEKNYLVAKTAFDEIKSYLPSYSNVSFPNVDLLGNIKPSLDTLIKQLDEKKKDIASNIHENIDIKNIKNNFTTLESILKQCNAHILGINTAKSKISNEIRMLKRQLCISGLNDLKKANKEQIEELFKLVKDKNDLEVSIKEKENNEKALKKDIVYNEFSRLIQSFFPNKYSFDVESGEITFQDTSIQDKISYFFSEGERRVLSFCFYLAMTHSLIENDSEYENLFFIIDDPISSLDFRYNYAVCNIIKDISRLFPKIKRERIIIFTHSLEFMSTLIRNHVINGQFFISREGELKRMGNKALLPYYSHLEDILYVSKLIPGIECSFLHTIPNSIRHVLETICKFTEHRDKNLDDFIQENDILKSNAYLQQMINDLSHGNWRLEKPICEEELQKSCETVCKYIESKFKGQIDSLSA
ncbi:FtsZ-binding cell division protein ZapB [Elusimicrobium simillimum]|uniref:AAA family ATPase n=1 Tax=Elusimicrobium simillimum TaxID=3143438 RepID=UPI003C6FD41A